MFHIIITEETIETTTAREFTATSLSEGTTSEDRTVERYSQRVDLIDLQSIIRAVNTPPKPPRADKGMKRKVSEVPKTEGASK